MKAFILAAGEGTRMRPLTANIPKPLLPVAGKPFLIHTIETLREVDIKDIIILLGWKGKRIREFLGDGSAFGVSIEYEEQSERLGTAHAIGLAGSHVQGSFLCLNGDIVLTRASLRDFLDFSKGKETSIALTQASRPEDFGVVVVKDEKVRDILEKPEKPPAATINAGMYLFTQSIFEAIEKTGKSPRGEYEITDSLKILMEKEDVHAFLLPEDWVDVGKPWDLLRANEILLKALETDIEARVEKNVHIEGPVVAGKGTIIRGGSYIRGPVVIGKNTEIGPNCLIRASTYIGDDCKVGNACEVKNSIVMAGTHIPHQNYLGDSIIGERCNFGSGAKVANLRLDEKNIKVYIKGKEIDTGLRKLGVIMGDDVKTGINSCIDVGTFIGENSLIGPGAFARGVIAPRSRIQ